MTLCDRTCLRSGGRTPHLIDALAFWDAPLSRHMRDGRSGERPQKETKFDDPSHTSCAPTNFGWGSGAATRSCWVSVAVGH